MTGVYASVIVPTHDRAATLPLAVDSIRRQTVSDIEIVLSGDGATDPVRAAARALVAADPRVVFHDFPKAPKRGGENRDRAVRAARADRIFYCDDDDLLLPRHVETLGAALDDVDAADSLPAFVSRSGRLQVGLVDHARGPMRHALAAGTAKTTYDTHFAHRRSAYARVGHPWAADSDTIARDFFRRFAADRSIIWKTIPVVTALSFNGRARQHLAPSDRRAEMERWIGKSPDNPFYEWHAFAFARATGLTSLVSADLLALLRGEPIASADIALRLADPLIGWPRPNLDVAELLLRSLGSRGALDALGRADVSNPYDREMRDFLESWLLMVDGRPREALERLDHASFYRSEASVQAALAFRQMGRRDDALQRARAAVGHDPALKTAQRLAVDLCIESGKIEAARRTADDARPHLPAHVADALDRRVARAEKIAAAPPPTVLEPRRGLGRLGLAELAGYRHLLWTLTLRQMRGRYRPTLIGWGWIVLQPLVYALVYFAVFGLLLKVDTGPVPYPAFVFSGVLLWLFFSGGVTSASNSLVSNYSVITRVYYPRLLLPLTSVLVNALELLAGLVVLAALVAAYGLKIDARALWAPLFLAGILLCTVAAGVLVAALSVRVRDVLLGMPSALRVLMYAMPFVYPASLIPDRFQFAYFLNPLAGFLQGFRWSLLGDAFPPAGALAASVAILAAALVAGLLYFNRVERTMVDLI